MYGKMVWSRGLYFWSFKLFIQTKNTKPNFWILLFDKNSKAEVPVFGKIGDDIISGQIDRLSIVDDVVYLVDYKNTNVLPKYVPQKYVKQLELYKKVLEKIYLDKIIKTYILWTSFGKIEEVEVN